MRKLSLFWVVVILLLGVFVGAFAALPSTPDVSANEGRESQIREASKAWDEAFNAEDLSALMALYADGAVSMPRLPCPRGEGSDQPGFRVHLR